MAAVVERDPVERVRRLKPLSLLPLVALIFYDVSGGPFGIEVRPIDRLGMLMTHSKGHGDTLTGLPHCCSRPSRLCRVTPVRDAVQDMPAHLQRLLQDAVSSGGPLAAVLGFAILPLIWSVPEAMITAELTTAFPENSGYVAWVTAAFGPYWGFMVRLALPSQACAEHGDTYCPQLHRCLPNLSGNIPRVVWVHCCWVLECTRHAGKAAGALRHPEHKHALMHIPPLRALLQERSIELTCSICGHAGGLFFLAVWCH